MALARRSIEPLPAFGAAFADVQGKLPGTGLRDWRQASFARFETQGFRPRAARHVVHQRRARGERADGAGTQDRRRAGCRGTAPGWAVRSPGA